MSVALPTYPGPKSASAVLLDPGGWQTPILGGDEIRLDRLGDKFSLAVTMPPMKWHTVDGVSAARKWSARLNRGVSEGVLMEFPQPDFSTAALFDGVVGAPAAAQSIAVQVNATGNGVTYPEGIFVTIKKLATGRCYLHQLRSDAVSAAGVAMFSLFPRIRVPLVAGDLVLIKAPMIEGRLAEPSSLEMEDIRTIGVSFQIQETR